MPADQTQQAGGFWGWFLGWLLLRLALMGVLWFVALYLLGWLDDAAAIFVAFADFVRMVWAEGILDSIAGLTIAGLFVYPVLVLFVPPLLLAVGVALYVSFEVADFLINLFRGEG